VENAREPTGGVRRSELVATLSLAADLGFGQPMEHAARSCLVAVRFADELGLDARDRTHSYWVALLGMVCNGESWELTRLFGDDIAFRGSRYTVGPSALAQMAYMVSRAGGGQPPMRRLTTVATMAATAGRPVMRSLAGHVELTAKIAERIGLGAGVAGDLERTFARWDGKGVPAGIAGDEVPRSVQLLQMCDTAEVLHRVHGIDRMTDGLRRGAGTQFDPELAQAFARAAPGLLGDLDEATTWDDVIAAEPSSSLLRDGELEDALEVFADVADLKSPWFGGHSRGVARLVADAARGAGLPEGDVTTVRRAALVHDLGRTGVSNAIWDKPGPLTGSERERVRLHAYLTERMLRRPKALAGLAAVAASDHERLDGSGYHRSIGGGSVPVLGRFLAAADEYHAMLEDRPHRAGLPADAAADVLRRSARDGALDRGAVDAVLTAAGHKLSRVPAAPAGLTPREVEVLVLVARGATTRAVAERLGIAPKTAGNHVERIYTKIGASSRAAASLFAMQHGLLDTLEAIH
jgi:HD-GYP domain-containing protein (c-di-GMP phosphodiesterase class II)